MSARLFTKKVSKFVFKLKGMREVTDDQKHLEYFSIKDPHDRILLIQTSKITYGLLNVCGNPIISQFCRYSDLTYLPLAISFQIGLHFGTP